MGVQGAHRVVADIWVEAAEGHGHLGRRTVGGPEPQVAGRGVDRDGAAVALGEPREPAEEAFGLHLDRPAASRHLPGPHHPGTLGPARSGRLIVRDKSGSNRPP